MYRSSVFWAIASALPAATKATQAPPETSTQQAIAYRDRLV
ncbi:hypothetical protein [Allocoleopsis sp.]